MVKKNIDVLGDILKKAAIDPGYRPDFYKILLRSDIYILIDGNSWMTHDENTLKSDEKTSIITWKKSDGTLVAPIFTSEIEMAKAINGRESYICINAKKLFETNSNLCYVINPSSDYGKELTSVEIGLLLDKTFLSTDHPVILKKNTQIFLGQPKDYPNKLIENITSYFSGRSEVISAYLAQIYSSEDELPHFLIAINSHTDLSETFSELSVVIQATSKSHGYVDLMQLGKSSELDSYFETIEPFYKSK